jgi:hypothetical protein
MPGGTEENAERPQDSLWDNIWIQDVPNIEQDYNIWSIVIRLVYRLINLLIEKENGAPLSFSLFIC